MLVDQTPEAQLTLQQGIKIHDISVEALLVLPGVSDTLAENFIKSRQAVLDSQCLYPVEERYHALEKVKGIGIKTAKKLSRFFIFTCDGSAEKTRLISR